MGYRNLWEMARDETLRGGALDISLLISQSSHTLEPFCVDSSSDSASS
jgi:hypothetical protein